MPIFRLPQHDIWFPPSSEFDDDVVAVGGDLSAKRLISAYEHGIFPWYNDPGDIVWWCPEERCVLFLEKLKISHSMRNELNRKTFTVTMDTDFRGVVEGCRSGVREGATWLLDEMADAYCELHTTGLAHSVEVWQNGELAGGLYGVSMGHMFFGESMFARVSNSSKVALIFLAKFLQSLGWKMIDCQVYNPHLGSLGASTISRNVFLELLKQELKYEGNMGNWSKANNVISEE